MSAATMTICFLLLAQADGSAREGVSPAELKAKVNRLVLQLDDDERAQREAAEQALVQLGSEALSLLPPITPPWACPQA